MLTVEQLSVLSLPAIDLSLKAGEIVCLSGASGSGKTQLLRALAQLDDVSGRIRLQGRAMQEYPSAEWRRRVMLVPADPVWWFPSVGEHFIQPASVDFSELGLAEDIAHWDVTRLSSGERQRLALLRALERKPDVLLLDEPTAALDSDNVERVEQWIQTQTKNRAVLWISHDKAQIDRIADQHWQLSNDGLHQVAA